MNSNRTDEGQARGLVATAPLTDAGNAEVFAEMFAGLVLYDHARNRWLTWDSHRWRADDVSAITNSAITVARQRRQAAVDLNGSDGIDLHAWSLKSENAQRLAAMLSLAKARPGIADAGNDWDTTAGLLGVPNGVVELRTGALRDGKPSDRITLSCGCDYAADAPRVRWDRFVLEVLDTPENVEYVKRLIGAAASGDGSALQVLVFFLGAGGNGKSLLLRMVRRALAEYAYDLPASVMLAGGRNQHLHWLAGLEGARLVTCLELGDSETLNTERAKYLTGEDDVTADQKFKQGRTFKQTWLAFFTTNTEPRPTENTKAFWRRTRVVPTPNEFDPKAEPDLSAKLLDELPGILAWVVEGAVEFYSADGREGDAPADVLDATSELRDSQDPLKRMLGDDGFAERVDGWWTPSHVLFEAYTTWADRLNWTTGKPNVDPAFTFRSADSLTKKLGEQFARKRHLVVSWKTGSEKKLAGVYGVRVRPNIGHPLARVEWQTRGGPVNRTPPGHPPASVDTLLDTQVKS